MFALLTKAQQDIDTLDDAVKVFKLNVVSAADIQKGFNGAYLLIDRKTGKTISISLWETKEDAVDSEKSGYYQSEVNKFKEFSTVTPVLESYEVSVGPESSPE